MNPIHNPAADSVSSVSSLSGRIRMHKRVIAVLDLVGYTRACAGRDDLEVAAFLDDYYVTCVNAIREAGGRVVKFIGDAVLAVFEPEQCAAAVQRVLALNNEIERTAASHRIACSAGANIHLATIAEGELGPDGHRAYDIIGTGVNHTFTMGAGAGVRISEPVYRQLPSEQRSPWDKQKPPAVYRYAN